jgi:hypothetical protein
LRCTSWHNPLTFALHRITWLHRDGSVLGIPSFASIIGIEHEAAPNSSTGSASVTSDSRLSPPSGDAPETSPFRWLGYSKRQARPPEGDRPAPGTRGGIETSVALFTPDRTASAQFIFGSAGGPLRCAIVSLTVPCHRKPARGPIQANGVRDIAAAEAARGQAPVDKPRSTRSPLLPQLGRQLPPTVRCLTCHPVMSFLLMAVLLLSSRGRHRRVAPASRRSVHHVLRSQGGFGFLAFSLHDARNFLGSNAICFRHR